MKKKVNMVLSFVFVLAIAFLLPTSLFASETSPPLPRTLENYQNIVKQIGNKYTLTLEMREKTIPNLSLEDFRIEVEQEAYEIYRVQKEEEHKIFMATLRNHSAIAPVAIAPASVTEQYVNRSAAILGATVYLSGTRWNNGSVGSNPVVWRWSAANMKVSSIADSGKKFFSAHTITHSLIDSSRTCAVNLTGTWVNYLTISYNNTRYVEFWAQQ